MHPLSTQLGHFIGGGITLDQLRCVFRDYLLQHHDQREVIAQWLRKTVEEGRLSANIWLSLRDLFEQREALSLDAALAAVQQPAAQPCVDPPTTIARADGDTTLIGAPGRDDALRPGTVLRERFVLVERLGSGGMGEVFKARDLRREEAQDRQPFIALKVLNQEVSAHPDSFMALQREARRAGMLAHPNVVTVYDFDRDEERIYMTMEYLEGRGLDVFMREEAAEGLPLQRAWPILRDVGLALEYGHHKRIVHSDLKPGNIFVCNDGVVKVLDFGIARLISPTTDKAAETLFDPARRFGGLTPAYASLEMWNGEPPDARDDVYAFACVAYELLSGRHPYDRLSAKTADARGLTPRRLESLTRAQWDSLRRALELHRDRRARSVAQLIKPFAPPSRLRKHALPLAAAALLTTAVTLAVSAHLYRNAVEDSTLQLLQCAQSPTPPAPAPAPRSTALTAEERQRIEENLTLANLSLTEVSLQTPAEDLKYVLSDGPNNVNDILDAVLALDPTHPGALQLKATVAALYGRRAKLLLGQQQAAQALDMVRYGRKVLPASDDLFRLEQSVCRAQASAKAG